MTACTTCGQQHSRCTAHNRARKPCGQNPLPGGSVCHLHGGKAPQVQAKAAERRAEQAAAATLADLGHAAPVTNPLEHLLHLAGEHQTWLAVVRGQLATIEALVAAGQAGEDARAIVKLYERALAKTAGILTDIARLDIEARLTAIAERDMARVEAAYADVWQAGRDGLPLDEARRRAARHLRAVG